MREGRNKSIFKSSGKNKNQNALMYIETLQSSKETAILNNENTEYGNFINTNNTSVERNNSPSLKLHVTIDSD